MVEGSTPVFRDFSPFDEPEPVGDLPWNEDAEVKHPETIVGHLCENASPESEYQSDSTGGLVEGPEGEYQRLRI